jgi:endoglucanase
MHHDKDWILQASTDYDTMIAKYRAIWSQLADRFGNYPENLVFESMNEIGFDDLGTQKGAELVNKINGEFVQLVRNSGKYNDKRFLLLAGYWTDIDRSVGNITNQGDDRAIISVHYYSPSTFAIADKSSTWGYQETWGTEEDYKYLQGQMDKLKKAYLDQGVAVIIGEYGCLIKDKDMQSRIKYLSAVTEYVRKYGMCPVLWDNRQEINRSLLQWNTEGLADAIRTAR